MDFVDIISKQIEGESELKKPMNALICFAKPETGKALMALVSKMMKENAENTSISIINLIDRSTFQQIENKEIYKSELFTDILAQNSSEKITVHALLKESDNFVEDILQIAREQNSDIIFTGIGHKLLDATIWHHYTKINEDKTKVTESEILGKLPIPAEKAIHNVSSLLERNPLNSGILVVNNFSDAKKVFVPILSYNDISTLRYIYHLSKNEDVRIKIWDATGILEIIPKLKKVFQFVVKKSESRISLWDNDTKIEEDFIKSNDLIITGIDGWKKMIVSALSWTSALPSVLIIKDKQPD